MGFVVYLHKRPCGEIFYVGKGVRRRAFDFAPSRRTEWHKSIVAKYGRENIVIELFECADECAAFFREREEIAKARASGARICNLTDGGEGCTGRPITAAQQAGLVLGRLRGRRGRKGDRPEFDAWRKTEAGREHQRVLGELGRARLHRERTVVCCCCANEFVTRSAKAKACSRLCEQRYRRARDADASA